MGRTESDVSVLSDGMELSVPFNDSGPDVRFVVLKPGKFYDVERTHLIQVSIPTATGVSSVLAQGEHVLQIVVETWPASIELAERSRKKWNKWGTLWYAPMTSLPMSFNVQESPTIENCVSN